MLVERRIDGYRRVRVDRVRLRFEPMVLDAVDAHRLKGAVPDMQRDFRGLHAADRKRVHQLGSEVQTRGRRRHRPAAAREHCLVADAIVLPIAALDVGRQRHMADRVNGIINRRAVVGPESNDAPAKEALLEHLGVQSAYSFEHHPRPRSQFLPRVHQRFPHGTGVTGV